MVSKALTGSVAETVWVDELDDELLLVPDCPGAELDPSDRVACAVTIYWLDALDSKRVRRNDALVLALGASGPKLTVGRYVAAVVELVDASHPLGNVTVTDPDCGVLI